MATISSEIIPRERLSAWQRWELAALPANVPEPSPVPAAQAPSPADLARAQAAAEGRAAGYAEGRAAAAAEQARLREFVDALGVTVVEHEQHLVDEVLDLALVLARQLVGEALAVRRELLLPIVSAALRQLPQASQRIEVVVNPADLELVRAHLDTAPLGPRCQLVTHAGIAPCGCRIETEQCEVDATVSSRWKRLLAALGRSDDWLEPA